MVRSCRDAAYRTAHLASRVFQRMAARRALRYKHQAGTLLDYNAQPLLPYVLSSQGPPLAVADVNGDGLDDVFGGGAGGGPGWAFSQQKAGSAGGSAEVQ